MSATLEEKKAELLRKIKWPQERLQRICVCVDAYQIINSIEPTRQPELFRWFLETADDIWFANPPREQADSSARNKVLSKMFGEADAAKLLELLNDPAEMSDDQSDPAGHPIPPDASLTVADVTRCRAKYMRSVNGLVDRYSNENYPAQEYYRLLLTAFDSLLSDCTAEEKGICLYTILIDKRTPYQEVSKGLCMPFEDYCHIIESIQPSIQKMRYILALRNTYQTEPASQLLSVLESLESSEKKTAFLCELMSELQPDEDD